MNQQESTHISSVTPSVSTVSNCPLWTALITPFNHDGSIDFDSLANAAKLQAQAGNGILLLGSTGEGVEIGRAHV